MKHKKNKRPRSARLRICACGRITLWPQCERCAGRRRVTLNLTVNGHILNTREFTDSVVVPALREGW